MITRSTILGFATLLLAVLAVGGCSIQQPFPGAKNDQVWAAMKAVAQQPDYESAHYTKRWTIVDNFVDIDEKTHVIEIDRSLERILQRPMTTPLYQTASWIFTVKLVPGTPPAVMIHNRGMSLPTKFQFEAQRFFADMKSLLDGPMDRSVGQVQPTGP